MENFESKLNSILNDPNAMAQIMNLAQSLGGGTKTAADPSPPPSETAPDYIEAFTDMKLLSGMAELLQQHGTNDDRRTALLNALRPFVKEQRYSRVDKAVQIAKLSRMIRIGLEMFKAKEDGNV